jgi:hypothetical protein
MLSLVVDRINLIAMELIGDVLIENYEIVEEYKDELFQIIE